MTRKNYFEYAALTREPFVLYPPPKGPDHTIKWQFKKFIAVGDNETHAKIQDIESEKIYDLPLVLIEFVNPGVMRLTREVSPWNGSFV